MDYTSFELLPSIQCKNAGKNLTNGTKSVCRGSSSCSNGIVIISENLRSANRQVLSSSLNTRIPSPLSRLRVRTYPQHNTDVWRQIASEVAHTNET